MENGNWSCKLLLAKITNNTYLLARNKLFSEKETDRPSIKIISRLKSCIVIKNLQNERLQLKVVSITMNWSHLIRFVYTAPGVGPLFLILAKWKKHPLTLTLHYRFFFSALNGPFDVLRKPSSITNTRAGEGKNWYFRAVQMSFQSRVEFLLQLL